MMTVGFVLFVLGALISIAFFNHLSWGCLVGEEIGFVTTSIGFLLILNGIAYKLRDAMP